MWGFGRYDPARPYKLPDTLSFYRMLGSPLGVHSCKQLLVRLALAPPGLALARRPTRCCSGTPAHTKAASTWCAQASTLTALPGEAHKLWQQAARHGMAALASFEPEGEQRAAVGSFLGL